MCAYWAPWEPMIENEQILDDNCSACPMSDCRESRKAATGNGLNGWLFALSSICVFLLPLVLGITGASLFDSSDTSRFIAGTIGMFGGMAVTAAIYRLVSRNK